MSSVIRVENLSKLYRLGEVGTGSLAHDINRWWHRIRGKEDPYSQVGQVNDRTRKARKLKIENLKGGTPSAFQRFSLSAFQRFSLSASSDYVYALKDINFEVKQGEVLGIIGRNGAGKSTLLKILSRVTAPSSGEVKVKGRIASLLEVGTGFHPDLTGRENVYLNGSILGMRKKEIDRKLDEIVAFSGCDAYLDTPVKRYSSGMQVRLAFAVAAHLDPEILIVDEVLAVGDVEFQQKCFRKMDEVAEKGRTVLLVSHQMGMVRRLCSRALLLEKGVVVATGSSAAIVEQYTSGVEDRTAVAVAHFAADGGKEAQILSVAVVRGDGTPVTAAVPHDEPLSLRVEYSVKKPLPDLRLGLSVCDRHERVIFTSSTACGSEGLHGAVLRVAPKTLMAGRFLVAVGLHIPRVHTFDLVNPAISFSVIDAGSEFAQYEGVDNGCVFVSCSWGEANLLQ